MEELSDVAGRRKRLMSQTEQSNSSSLIPQIGRDLSIDCLSRCPRSDYGSIAKVNRSFRSLVRTGELHRASRNRGIVEHWVYFRRGSFDWMCFDPVGIRWMHLPRVPSDNFRPAFERPLAVGNELLLFGKELTGLQAIYKFSILTNSWSLGREMNEPRRRSFGSASLGEIAIVAGGFDAENHNILSSAEIYNSDTGTWESLPRMNIPRKKCSGVFMDGNFYVVGGIGVGNPNGLTCGEMYDLKTRRWHEIPNMFPARTNGMSPPLLAVVKNELYAAFYSEKEVRKYDKGRNLWSTVGTLPEPEGAVSMNGWGAYGDKLILIATTPEFGGIEVYDCVPDEGPLQWSLLTFDDELAIFFIICPVMSC